MKAQTQLILAGVLALCGSLPAAAFDLAAAVKAARDYDASYAGARQTLLAGQEKAVQGRALLLPTVGLSAGITRTDAMKPDADPYNTRSVGVQLSQPLFDVASYTGYKQGQISSELAGVQFAASSQQLVADVAKAYFNVLLAEDVLSVTRATKKAYERQLAQAKKAFEVGTATITDTHEAQAGYDAAQASEIAAVSDLEIKRNTLTNLTGLDAEKINHLRGSVELEHDSGSLPEWLNRAEAGSLSIKSARQQLQLAEESLTAARGKHLPTVALTAGYSNSHTTEPTSVASGRGNTAGNTLGLNLSLPLYAGGGINSQVRAAAANLEKARDDVEVARRDTALAVRSAWLGVSNGAAQVKAQEQLLVSAKSKLDATRLGREVGVRTNLDLLNAESSYQDAVRALASARYNLLYARLALALAAGELDDQAVATVNRFF
ncbi:TolC family outer membrane protein [Vogesella oryzae]|uniref:TolC family outer membrane protein n=1 Tax=Vogesella oryzae TaxID=1735285 RepID=UPI001582C4F1|nr:TolC family outer membrane protein [Vogesella oryzae]